MPCCSGSKASHTKSVEFLYNCLDNGVTSMIKDCDMDLKTSVGATALHYAAARNKGKLMLELINRGANLNSKMLGGYTPLHVAIMERCKNACIILLDHFADVNAVDDSNRTPLHLASFEGTLPEIGTLMSYNADATIKDQWGWTPELVLENWESNPNEDIDQIYTHYRVLKDMFRNTFYSEFEPADNDNFVKTPYGSYFDLMDYSETGDGQKLSNIFKRYNRVLKNRKRISEWSISRLKLAKYTTFLTAKDLSLMREMLFMKSTFIASMFPLTLYDVYARDPKEIAKYLLDTRIDLTMFAEHFEENGYFSAIVQKWSVIETINYRSWAGYEMNKVMKLPVKIVLKIMEHLELPSLKNILKASNKIEDEDYDYFDKEYVQFVKKKKKRTETSNQGASAGYAVPTFISNLMLGQPKSPNPVAFDFNKIKLNENPKFKNIKITSFVYLENLDPLTENIALPSTSTSLPSNIVVHTLSSHNSTSKKALTFFEDADKHEQDFVEKKTEKVIDESEYLTEQDLFEDTDSDVTALYSEEDSDLIPPDSEEGEEDEEG